MESYKHKLAKEVLKDWMEDSYKHKIPAPVPLSLFSHQQEKVFLEYPITKELLKGWSLIPLWDESPWQFEFEGNNPDYKWCIDNNHTILTILDVAIPYNGFLSYGVEIVHTNPPNQKKKDLFAYLNLTYNISFYTIEADWILDQVKRPKALNTNEVNIHELVSSIGNYPGFTPIVMDKEWVIEGFKVYWKATFGV